MTVSDKVYIDIKNKDPKSIQQLIKACTYANPLWSIARNLGYSVYRIPKDIRTARIDRDRFELALCRGEIRKAFGVFPTESVRELGVDRPSSFLYHNPDFELDAHQRRAIGSILSSKQGIIHATTSAGKTHIVLAAASKLGQKCLIVVHRKILMQQFLEDIGRYLFFGKKQDTEFLRSEISGTFSKNDGGQKRDDDSNADAKPSKRNDGQGAVRDGAERSRISGRSKSPRGVSLGTGSGAPGDAGEWLEDDVYGRSMLDGGGPGGGGRYRQVVPGVIGDGSFTIGDQITVALEKTLAKHPEVYKEFGAVFLDECHLCPAATFQKIMNNMPARYRYGLTGTMVRKDNKQFLIYATFGQIIAKIQKEELLALGRVSPVKVEIVESDSVLDYNDLAATIGVTRAWGEVVRYLHCDEGRRTQILNLAYSLAPAKTVVLTGRVDACYELAAAYSSRFGKESGAITGRDSRSSLDVYKRFLAGEIRVVFATVGCFSTGVSVNDLEHLILSTPIFGNELLLHQIRGRLMRTAEGKREGTCHFIWDPGVFPHYRLKQFLKIMDK